MKAATDGDLDNINGTLTKAMELDLLKDVLNSQDEKGKSGLHLAIGGRKEEAAKLLINKGCDVNTITNEKHQYEGDTPLMTASYYGMDTIVKKLVENGAVINRMRKDKGTAVNGAAQQGHLTTLKFLLEKDASLADKKSYEGRTPLGGAAMHGHLECVKFLLTKHKVNISEQDDYKATALCLAAYFNQPLVVEYLLQQGADPSIRGIGNKTPLELSLQENNDNVTKILNKYNNIWKKIVSCFT